MKVALINKNCAVSKLINKSLDRLCSTCFEIDDISKIDDNFDCIIVDDEIDVKNINLREFSDKIIVLVSKNSSEPSWADVVVSKPFLPTDFIDIFEKKISDLNVKNNKLDSLNEITSLVDEIDMMDEKLQENSFSDGLESLNDTKNKDDKFFDSEDVKTKNNEDKNLNVLDDKKNDNDDNKIHQNESIDDKNLIIDIEENIIEDNDVNEKLLASFESIDDIDEQTMFSLFPENLANKDNQKKYNLQDIKDEIIRKLDIKIDQSFVDVKDFPKKIHIKIDIDFED